MRIDATSAAERGADTIHWAFDEHQHRQSAITRRVQQRFERCDWIGTRLDTVERLTLYPRSIRRTFAILRDSLGPRLADRELWAAMKSAYTRAIIGRNDFELAGGGLVEVGAALRRAHTGTTSRWTRAPMRGFKASSITRSTGTPRSSLS
jgi:isocitrate dehydrogenase kinase/phosphatase